MPIADHTAAAKAEAEKIRETLSADTSSHGLDTQIAFAQLLATIAVADASRAFRGTGA